MFEEDSRQTANRTGQIVARPDIVRIGGRNRLVDFDCIPGTSIARSIPRDRPLISY